MLSIQERDIVRLHGIAALHDYQINSIVHGEVFLERGVLSYYDGKTLLICGQSMRDVQPPSSDTAEEIVCGWISRERVESLVYVGPEPINLTWLTTHKFSRLWLQRRLPREAELFLPAGLDVSARVVRRATRNGFEPKHLHGGSIQAVHLSVAERFYRDLALTDYLAGVAVSLPASLLSPGATIIEAWEQGVLRGFTVVHEPFEGLSHALFIAHDRKTRGVCDFLYSRLIRHAASVGSQFVNVGPSPTQGHYHFKRKWHAEPLVPPYYAAMWIRRGVRFKLSDRPWLLRILGRG